MWRNASGGTQWRHHAVWRGRVSVLVGWETFMLLELHIVVCTLLLLPLNQFRGYYPMVHLFSFYVVPNAILSLCYSRAVYDTVEKCPGCLFCILLLLLCMQAKGSRLGYSRMHVFVCFLVSSHLNYGGGHSICIKHCGVIIQDIWTTV